MEVVTFLTAIVGLLTAIVGLITSIVALKEKRSKKEKNLSSLGEKKDS